MASYSIGEAASDYDRPQCPGLTIPNHRIVPGFLVQTGDKTGTGGGGESIYGGSYYTISSVLDIVA